MKLTLDASTLVAIQYLVALQLQVFHQTLSTGLQPVKLIVVAALVPSQQLQLSHPAGQLAPCQGIRHLTAVLQQWAAALQ